MSVQTTVRDLEEYLVALCATEERLAAEWNETKRRIEAVRSTLHTFPDWRMSNPVVETLAETSVTIQDIADCKTQREALEVIAMLSKGIVRSKIAGRLLMDADLSKSQTLKAANASAYRIMHDRSEWEYHTEGTFRYKPFFAQSNDDALPEAPSAEPPQIHEHEVETDASNSLYGPMLPEGEPVLT